jgi:zinc protease
MTINLRAIAFCLSACFFFMQFSPASGQEAAVSDQNDAFNFDALKVVELDNGLSITVIEDSGFQKNALALNWNYISGLEGSLSGLKSAHMRCLLKKLEETLPQFAPLDWDSLEVSGSDDFIGLVSPAQNIESIIDWLADGVTSFNCDSTNWSVVQSEMQSELQVAGSSNGHDSMNPLMNHILFSENHPYGEMQSPESIAAIQSNAINNLHQQLFRPNNCRIVICLESANDFSHEDARAAFANWKTRSVAVSNLTRPGLNSANDVAWIASDATAPLRFQLGHVMRLKPADEDAWVLKMLADIIQNRIQSLSAAESLVLVDFEADKHMGRFMVYGIDIPEARMKTTLESTQEILQLITKELPTEDEINAAQERLIERHVAHLVDASYVAKMEASLPGSEWIQSKQHARSKLESISSNDVRRVANNLLRPKNLNIIGQGPRALGIEIGTAMDGDGDVEWYTANGTLIEPYLPAPGLTASSVFEAFYESCGGTSAFEALKSSRTTMRMDAGGGTVFTVETTSLYGTGFVASFEANGQVMMENVVTLKEGFKRQMGVIQPMSASEYDRLKPDIYLARFLHLEDLNGAAKVLGTFETNGTIQNVVRIHFGDQAVETLFFDAKSSRLVESTVERTGAAGKNKTTYGFESYQTYDGLTFPSIITQTTNGRKVQLLAERIELEVRINADIFKRN